MSLPYVILSVLISVTLRAALEVAGWHRVRPRSREPKGHVLRTQTDTAWDCDVSVASGAVFTLSRDWNRSREKQ
jgi:hypothetical protein